MSEYGTELLEKIRKDFVRYCNNDTKFRKLLVAVEQDTADYVTASKFSVRLGELLSRSLQENINQDNLSGNFISKELAQEILEPLLINNYAVTAEVCKNIQTNLNKASGIGLTPQVAKLDTNRLQGLIDKVASYDTLEQGNWVLGEPITNYTQAVVDYSIAENMKVQSKAGMEPVIHREYEARACKWCVKQAGTYKYAEVRETGNKVYQRHENCRCIISYVNGRHRTDVNTKAEWEVEDDYRRREIIEERQQELATKAEQVAEKRKAYNAKVEQVVLELGYSPKSARAWLNFNNKKIEDLGLDYMLDLTRLQNTRALTNR